MKINYLNLLIFTGIAVGIAIALTVLTSLFHFPKQIGLLIGAVLGGIVQYKWPWVTAKKNKNPWE